MCLRLDEEEVVDKIIVSDILCPHIRENSMHARFHYSSSN